MQVASAYNLPIKNVIARSEVSLTQRKQGKQSR